MQNKLVTVFGGSGFLGRYVIAKLVERGAFVRVAVRNVDQAHHLKMASLVGQISIVSVNLSDEKSIESAIGDSDYVVNLIGILFESGRATFEKMHAQLPQKLAEIAHKQKVERFVHVSAIGASVDSKSLYSITKAKGELAVLNAFGQATIIRPSVIFGPEDNFFNQFASMATVSPFLPLIGGGVTKLQPVYVDDVAEAIACVLKGDTSVGKTYELGGPSVYTFKELMTFLIQTTKRKCLLMRIPYSIATLMASVLQLMPTPQLTRDQVKLLQQDNIVHSGALTFKDLKIEPAAVEAIVPVYLERYRRQS